MQKIHVLDIQDLGNPRGGQAHQRVDLHAVIRRLLLTLKGQTANEELQSVFIDVKAELLSDHLLRLLRSVLQLIEGQLDDVKQHVVAELNGYFVLLNGTLIYGEWREIEVRVGLI